jgi:protein O-GlcNAc transferase
MEHFVNLQKTQSDKKCAELIAEDGIHILVNLNGHTAGDRNGISALRPAPIQLVYLAYPGTMGAEYIDYNVVDPHVCPPEHREHYTEKLLRMPHCYQANSFSELYRDVLLPENLPSRADHNLPDRPVFVFCNFCRLGRITKDLWTTWMRILKRVNNSVLWLYRHPKAAVLRLVQKCREHDVSPDRVIFAPPCSPKVPSPKSPNLIAFLHSARLLDGT